MQGWKHETTVRSQALESLGYKYRLIIVEPLALCMFTQASTISFHVRDTPNLAMCSVLIRTEEANPDKPKPRSNLIRLDVPESLQAQVGSSAPRTEPTMFQIHTHTLPVLLTQSSSLKLLNQFLLKSLKADL